MNFVLAKDIAFVVSTNKIRSVRTVNLVKLTEYKVTFEYKKKLSRIE